MQKGENPVFAATTAYQTTAALIAAVKLDLFTAIGSAAMTADKLGARVGAAPRGIQILCDYLTVVELLEKRKSRYALTPSAKILLDRASPLAMGGTVEFIAAPETLALFFNDPVSYVRRGGAEGLANVSPDHPIWIRFANAMAPLAATTAKLVAAYVVALSERPSVAFRHRLRPRLLRRRGRQGAAGCLHHGGRLGRGPRRHARQRRGRRRDRPLSLRARERLELDWGRDYDLILLPNFLHHFDVPTCEALLGKVKKEPRRRRPRLGDRLRPQ